MHKVLLLALGLLLSSPASAATKSPEPSAPQPGGPAIIAVVGDEIITSYDFENRMRFVMVTTRLSPTPEVIQRLRPQVLRSLIDEKLQLQAALSENITASDQEVLDAIAAIEAQRNMPQGTIPQMLKANGVPESTFAQQLRSQISWRKLVGRKLRQRVKVSDEEVALARQRSAAPEVALEYQISVLSIPVEKKQREPEVRALLEKITSEVKKGANFEEVARQIGGNASGKMEKFWVNPEQMDPMVARVIKKVKSGDISPPLRNETSYAVIKVHDTRPLEEVQDTEVTLKEILLKLKETADAKEANILLQIGEEVAKHPGSCQEKGVASIKDIDDFDISVRWITENLSRLPTGLRIIAESLNVGDISSPLASYEGIRLYMMCDRKTAVPARLDPEQIRESLQQQKLELEAQKYMRNLRREAYIEIKSGE